MIYKIRLKLIFLIFNFLFLTFNFQVYAFDFLKIGTGAAPASMGGAFVGKAEGANAVYWNPAALSLNYNKQVIFSHNNLFKGIKYNYFAFTSSRRGKSGFGVDIIYLNFGDIKSYNTANFNASDLSFGVSYGKTFGKVSVGTTIRYIKRKIADYSDSIYTVNFGFMLEKDKYTVGITGNNVISGGIKFLSETERPPLAIRAGIKFYAKNNLILTFDTEYRESNLKYFAGAEYNLNNIFFRAGYNTNSSKITFGLGFEGQKFGIDYAFIPHKYLGATHWVTLNIFWGKREKNENSS